jgi:hypothetical protein
MSNIKRSLAARRGYQTKLANQRLRRFLMQPNTQPTQPEQGDWRKAWTQEFIQGKRLYEIWEHKDGTRVIAQRLYSEDADRILADHEIARIAEEALRDVDDMTGGTMPITAAIKDIVQDTLTRISALKGQTNA